MFIGNSYRNRLNEFRHSIAATELPRLDHLLQAPSPSHLDLIELALSIASSNDPQKERVQSIFQTIFPEVSAAASMASHFTPECLERASPTFEGLMGEKYSPSDYAAEILEQLTVIKEVLGFPYEVDFAPIISYIETGTLPKLSGEQLRVCVGFIHKFNASNVPLSLAMMLPMTWETLDTKLNSYFKSLDCGLLREIIEFLANKITKEEFAALLKGPLCDKRIYGLALVAFTKKFSPRSDLVLKKLGLDNIYEHIETSIVIKTQDELRAFRQWRSLYQWPLVLGIAQEMLNDLSLFREELGVVESLFVLCDHPSELSFPANLQPRQLQLFAVASPAVLEGLGPFSAILSLDLNFLPGSIFPLVDLGAIEKAFPNLVRLRLMNASLSGFSFQGTPPQRLEIASGTLSEQAFVDFNNLLQKGMSEIRLISTNLTAAPDDLFKALGTIDILHIERCTMLSAQWLALIKGMSGRALKKVFLETNFIDESFAMAFSENCLNTSFGRLTLLSTSQQAAVQLTPFIEKAAIDSLSILRAEPFCQAILNNPHIGKVSFKGRLSSQEIDAILNLMRKREDLKFTLLWYDSLEQLLHKAACDPCLLTRIVADDEGA